MSDVYGASAPGGHLYGSGFPSWLANLPAAVQAGIGRVANYANPVQPAAAADSVTQGANPAASPSPVSPALANGGPLVPPGLLGGGQPPAPMPPGAPTPPVPANAAAMVGDGSGGAGNSQSFDGPSILPQARGVMPVMGPAQGPTPWFTPSNTPYAPNPAIGAPPPLVRPVSNPAVARGSNRPAGASARIPSTATASVPPAGRSPFVQVDAQNQDWSGGALARGGPRQMSALDLSSLFGGGGRQAAPAAAIPASATASVPPNVTSAAPWNYGPYQKSMVRTPGQPYGPVYPRAPATGNF